MTLEVWKDVSGFPDYQVSNHGNLKSFRTMNTKIVSGFKDKDRNGLGKILRRYQLLYPNSGEKITIEAKILVYLTFVGPVPDKMYVQHADGNTLNNRLDNLVLAPRGWFVPCPNCGFIVPVLRDSKGTRLQVDSRRDVDRHADV